MSLSEGKTEALQRELVQVNAELLALHLVNERDIIHLYRWMQGLMVFVIAYLVIQVIR